MYAWPGEGTGPHPLPLTPAVHPWTAADRNSERGDRGGGSKRHRQRESPPPPSAAEATPWLVPNIRRVGWSMGGLIG